ncbi:hypothetical protein [Streptosporangium sp. NPDC050280]|uniref:hypothetical protein n=1 Tax=unclassified Streptosporangium TaxID=2632669 RepID=UPI00343DB4FE
MTDNENGPCGSEAAGVALVRSAYERWSGLPPVDVRVSRRDAYVVMGGLQLLLRHPALGDSMKSVFEQVGRDIQRLICDDVELYALAEAGWNPVYDVAE